MFMHPFEGMDVANINGKKRKLDAEAGIDDASRVLRSVRDVAPAHYTFKIQSFSLFLSTLVRNCESQAFEVGGYKWKLVLYPNGNKKKNVTGCISLYLAIADTESLPFGWEVNVDFKLFVYDHIRDKYLAIQVAEGGIKRFHRMNTEWGFDELLSLDALNDASNGYLVDDCCVFGAEVFVVKYNGQGECRSMIKDPMDNIYTWNVANLSSAGDVVHSDQFVVGENTWELVLYPKGEKGVNEGKGLSLYLQLAEFETQRPEQKVYCEYQLRIRNQVHRKDDKSIDLNYWFCTASVDGFGSSTALVEGFGSTNLLTLRDLNDASKGFVVNDGMIIEARFKFISSAKNF